MLLVQTGVCPFSSDLDVGSKGVCACMRLFLYVGLGNRE